MEQLIEQDRSESPDGDWCLVDLSDPITEEATKAAHALGMDFHDFMCLALEEKLAGIRLNVDLQHETLDGSLSYPRTTDMTEKKCFTA